MILSESLHPSLSRSSSFGSSNRIRLDKSVPGDFPATKDGVWLPQVEAVAQIEYMGAKAMLGITAVEMFMDKTDFDSKTGCWVPPEISNEEHVTALWELARWDMCPGGALEAASVAVRDQVQICDTENCLNTRHYDFTPSLKSRSEMMHPNPEHYATLPDGRISTVWGDTLPSVADSIAELRQFQLKCPPFTSEHDSPLTANGISKITIHPLTGCWMVRNYYTRKTLGIEMDGYGRLSFGKPFAKHRKRAYQSMAHRVVWRVAGHDLPNKLELNHLCGFRPCANPFHLEVATREQNIGHMVHMQSTITSLRSGNNQMQFSDRAAAINT